MTSISVFVAAIAGFGLGAVWYMVLAEPWMTAAQIKRGSDGKPEGGQDAKLFAMTFVLQVIVAGMMRAVFAMAGVDAGIEGLILGAAVGLFFITPWIAINNLYCSRPPLLTAIDGGYATLACAAMGLVLGLFA